jgi:hypothetical protein
VKKTGVSRIFPHVLKMRNKAWRKYDVDRTATTGLIGDEYIATLGIFRGWQHAAPPLMILRPMDMLVNGRSAALAASGLS